AFSIGSQWTAQDAGKCRNRYRCRYLCRRHADHARHQGRADDEFRQIRLLCARQYRLFGALRLAGRMRRERRRRPAYLHGRCRVTVPGEILVEGPASAGEALVLTAPISFWGGVDPKTGRIADPRHPQHGEDIAGRVLFLPGTIGSSSASAVLLELVRAGLAPAAIVMHEPDAILLLGLIVAREMGWP